MYYPISKKHYKNIMNETDKISFDMINLLKRLQEIKSVTNITEEEIKVLKEAQDILIQKVDMIEDVVENKDNTFYDADKCE